MKAASGKSGTSTGSFPTKPFRTLTRGCTNALAPVDSAHFCSLTTSGNCIRSFRVSQGPNQTALKRETLRGRRGASWGRWRRKKRSEKRVVFSLCLAAWLRGCPLVACSPGLCLHADPKSNLGKATIQAVAAGHSNTWTSPSDMPLWALVPPGLGLAYRSQPESAFLSSGPCSKPLGGLSLNCALPLLPELDAPSSACQGPSGERPA